MLPQWVHRLQITIPIAIEFVNFNGFVKSHLKSICFYNYEGHEEHDALNIGLNGAAFFPRPINWEVAGQTVTDSLSSQSSGRE